MKSYNYLYLLPALFLMSCNESKDSKIKHSMEDLMNRFPELKVNQKSGSKFELIKSVKNFKSDFEIQLYSEPDSIDNYSTDKTFFVNNFKAMKDAFN